ncbi:hypothetical protein Rleg4DRAFT_1220 [Rhizobium leguminosarum bv. trifolii WSM2297]|uniref:Uncharacterized protein n=1 Tax=Rhizobium leguminosarum bv. trifolii WSM2297 TaxID=754762 RepID=J0KQ37_RHILT|nr:hypothetical protein [Rhizobium leguminosarum]EJC79624.1 hypothetical protein Rleg4DRAFT_1220 [Rhizobium leguminosarum bv. trifolii WSM2297]
MARPAAIDRQDISDVHAQTKNRHSSRRLAILPSIRAAAAARRHILLSSLAKGQVGRAT